MNVERLRRCATQLEMRLQAHKGGRDDVDFLIALPRLMRDISEAKSGKISEPRDPGLGIGIWMLESEINKYEDISGLLAEFRVLLRGWEPPNKPL